MVQAINFAVRDSAGGKQLGSVAGDGQGNFIQVGSGDSVSLNLAKESIVGYQQQGTDLVVQLSDGRAVVLSNYFDQSSGLTNHLYISSEGEMTEVLVQQSTDGALFADYGPVSGWDKWSPLDDLRFTTADTVSDAAYVANEPAGMAPFIPLLGGLAGGGGAAAAAVGAAALVAAGAAVSGGSDGATTTGTGTTPGGTTPGGGTGGLTDTTAPRVAINEGTKSVSHVETGADYTNGVQIGGTSEAGATIKVVVNGNTQTTTVGADGSWEVTFPQSQVAGGQYTTPVTVTATDAAGNSSTATDILVVDTVVNPFNHTRTETSSNKDDTVLNAVEATSGLTVGGTVEAGSTVMVQLGNGSSHAATVSGTTWTYTFAASEVTQGDLHNMTMTATATDSYGNVSAPISSLVAVDTLVSNFSQNAINTSAVKLDSVLNAAEVSMGVVLSGTVEARSTVVVTFGGVSHTATVTGTTWTTTFAANEVTAGDLRSVATTAVATDAYGNVSQTISTFVAVDTLVSNFTQNTINTSALKADSVLNGGEVAQGMTVSGTVEAGSTVKIKLDNGGYHDANVTGTTWTYTFAANEIPKGNTHNVVLTAVATDGAGNVSAPITSTVVVDTDVINFAKPAALLAGDGVLNAAEAAAGLVVSGTAEAYSSIDVLMANGNKMTTQSDASGNWTVTFATAQLPSGTSGSSSVTVTATDQAGNSENYTQTFTFDTVAPDAPWVVNDAGGGDTISGVFTAHSVGAVDYHAVSSAGVVTELSHSAVMPTTTMVGSVSVASDFVLFNSGSAVPNGSYLVISDTDTAGNESSTLYVRNTTGAVTIDLSRSGLQEFDFGAIDLSSSEASMRISEAQVMALTGPAHTLTVVGGGDDNVSLSGVTSTGASQTIHGQTYSLYNLGSDGAKVLVDTDIHVTLI